jgi:DNA processing protein
MDSQPLDEDLAAWLRLLTTPKLSRRAARALLARFGSPTPIFASDEATLVDAVGPTAARAVLVPWPDGAERLDATARWLASAAPGVRHRLIPLGDPLYPERWLAMADPPLVVFAAGQVDRDRLQRPALAVVGSRHPTPQGVEHARAFARHLGEVGWSIVSGLALGIDAAAHEAALDTAGGTVAIVGTGLDTVYPARHRALFDRLMANGLVLSEYPLGTPPLAAHFPERNRLIAGLGRGTLVVEAALQSGSLITARLALEVGADVFAIPGSIHSPQSRGCHALIKQGAKLVESADDILVELAANGPVPGKSSPVAVPTDATAVRAPADKASGKASGRASHEDSGRDDPLLAAMGWDPISLDALSARTGYGAELAGARLLDFELAGVVRRLPGQLFQRCASA